jgi:hypothetical protein
MYNYKLFIYIFFILLDFTVYPNKEGLDFENVEDFEAAQTIDLVADVNGLVKYPIKCFLTVFCP